MLHHFCVSRPESAFTVLAFEDFTVDTRSGCNSMFMLPGHLTFEGAVTMARLWFPEIFARLDAAGGEVRQYQ
jgi:hypothetical protein